MAEDKLRLGDEYEIERYALWTRRSVASGSPDLERDDRGRVIWHGGQPSNKEWDRVGLVTVDYDLEGEGHFRNIPIHPDRPLDPYGSDQPGYRGVHKGGRYGPEYYYDLDDLVTNWFWSTDTP